MSLQAEILSVKYSAAITQAQNARPFAASSKEIGIQTHLQERRKKTVFARQMEQVLIGKSSVVVGILYCVWISGCKPRNAILG